MGPLDLTAQALPDEHAWHKDAPPADTYPGLQAAHDNDADIFWYLDSGQPTHNPVMLPSKYLPAGQAVHPDIEAVPVLLVVWPEGHCRQDREAFAGWYFPIEHDSHC